jgi:hypothetical protein
MDITTMNDNDLLDMLARNRRTFVTAEAHEAYAVWQRIGSLVDECRRRRFFSDVRRDVRRHVQRRSA